MGNLLDLEFVSHISLVDDPAVGDSEYVVMKRAGSGSPGNIRKDGKTLSSDNASKLEAILQSVRRGKMREAEDALEGFLTDQADLTDLELDYDTEKTMGNDNDTFDVEKFTKDLKTAVKEAAAEGIQEGMEQALPEDGASAEGGEDPSTPEVDGGAESEALQRIQALEEQIQEQEEDPESPEAGGGDGGSAEGGEDALEKRLAAIEKSLEQDGRKGQGTALDVDPEERESVAKNGTWNATEAITKSGGEE